ncbi:MAG: L-arabinolactonase [Pedobacter sp.]|nr:L-arabinolactonase [Pedobacter sp.]
MVTVIGDKRSFLAEGPIWDALSKSLLYVDIIDGLIHEYYPDTDEHKTINVHQMVGAIALCEDGRLLAALKAGLAYVCRETGKFDVFTNPESHLPGNRFNDGKCDPSGRLWIGTMDIDEKANAGSVYMLDTDQGITKKIENTTISNGMAWSPNHKIFYYIDTPTMTVVAYDYDCINGFIRNKRVVIFIEDIDGYPDGMTIDCEGMLWIAHWGGWQVSRWDPQSGKKLFTLPMPVANVSSCTFGGEDLNDLYITSAQKGLSEDALASQPLAGSVFVWKNTGYKGMPAFEYKNLATI